MTTFREQKKQLRSRMRIRRSESKAAPEVSASIIARALEFLRTELPQETHSANSKLPGVLFTYLTAPDEVDTSASLPLLFETFAGIAVPAIVGKSMIPVRIFPSDEFATRASGVPAPSTEWLEDPRRIVAAEEISASFVPGIAFDTFGYRIGFGSGHYDRYFDTASKTTRRVGLAFEFQIIPDIPHEPHDVGMHAIATESRLIIPAV